MFHVPKELKLVRTERVNWCGLRQQGMQWTCLIYSVFMQCVCVTVNSLT